MSDVNTRYAEALERLTGGLRQDSCIVAAILVGSLSYDTVWERSDIDLMLVVEESQLKVESVCLVELGINVHVCLVTRSKFRKLLEGSAQGAFMHSMLGKGQILFSRDEALTELFEHRHSFGERDRQTQLLRVAEGLLPALTKAEKWLHAKQDYDYSFHWIMKCVDSLASIELLLNGEVPTREVIQRALTLNPPLFSAIYTQLIHAEPTPEMIEKALEKINSYLRDNVHEIFGLVLDYLRDEGEVRSISDIDHHFARTYSIHCVDSSCEWLSDEEYLQRVGVPVRLTPKSRVSMEEAAYYFPEGEEKCP